ncbi:MAG: head GIN domain-containing protein [Betaproteobacteria bacterium]
MNTLTRLRGRAIFLATMTTAALCGALAGPAQAEEGSSAKSKHFSWNFSFDFDNRISFGHNRTKGSGVVKEESRPVANFSRLTLALPATVTITQGATETLTIATDDNLLPLMITRVVGDELIVEGDKSRGFSTRREIRIHLTVKSLNAIAIKGSGDVIGDELKSDKFDIAISGSGDVKFKSIRAEQFRIGIKGSGDVSVDSLESKSVDTSILGSGDIRLPAVQASLVNISVKGSGDVLVAGNADKVDIEIMGSGDVRTRKLIAREAGVKIMASGDADVYAREKLTASVYGSGDVRYAGSPANVSRTVKGSGSIEAL